MRWPFLVCALVACSSASTKNEIGPDPSNPDGGEEKPAATKPGEGRSGTRLKARTMVGTDGSRAFVGWYDSELKTDCIFLKSSDGQTRCLPSGTIASGYYSDSECTKPAAALAKGCTPTKYVQTLKVSSCNATWTIYGLAALTPNVWTGLPGACSGVTSPAILNTQDFYAVGAEVPASSFVAGSEERE